MAGWLSAAGYGKAKKNSFELLLESLGEHFSICKVDILYMCLLIHGDILCLFWIFAYKFKLNQTDLANVKC